MLVRLLSIICLLGPTTDSLCQSIEDEVREVRKEISLYDRNPADDDQLTKAISTIAIVKEKAGSTIGPEIWELEARLYHQIAAQQLRSSQTDIRPSRTLLAIEGPALKAYDSYLSLLQVSKRKNKKHILANLASLQNLLLSRSVLDLQRKSRRELVIRQHRAILALHNLMRGAKMGSVLDRRMKWFSYQLALAAFYRGEVDTYTPLVRTLYEQGYETPGLYLLLYEAFAHRGTRGLAFRYLSEGRRKFPLHGDLMEAEVKYFFDLDQIARLKKRYEDQGKDQHLSLNQEYEIILLYNKLFKVYQSTKDTIAAATNFELAMDKIQSYLDQDQTDYLANLGAVLLIYDQFLVLVNELLLIGEECSRSSLRRYGVIRDKIDEVLKGILPYLDQIQDYSDNHLEILEISRTVNMVEAKLDLRRKYRQQFFQARMNPNNWHTYVIRQEWW